MKLLCFCGACEHVLIRLVEVLCAREVPVLVSEGAPSRETVDERPSRMDAASAVTAR